MTIRATLLLTMRYLFGTDRKSGRVRGAVVAIALSLVPLMVVLEVADGMIEGITARSIEVGTYHLQAIATGNITERSTQVTARVIGALPGVTGAYPERQGLGLISGPSSRSAVTIRAIDPRLDSIDPGFRKYLTVTAGIFDLSSADSIMLGTEVARSIGAIPGSVVRIITVRSFGGQGFIPKVSTFTVRGVFTTGYEELDRSWVFISFPRGVQILPADSSRTFIGIKVAHPYALPNPLSGYGGAGGKAADSGESLGPEISATLGPEWRVLTWYQIGQPQYESFLTTKNLLIFIMVLIVVIASINISSSILMLVMEKQQEIAILKSMGASPAGIRRTFLIVGFAAGGAGTVLGIGFGLFLAVNINELIRGIQAVLNDGLAAVSAAISLFSTFRTLRVDILSPQFYLDVIPIRIGFTDVTSAAVLSLLLSTLAAYLPARKAGATRPLVVMRKH